MIFKILLLYLLLPVGTIAIFAIFLSSLFFLSDRKEDNIK